MRRPPEVDRVWSTPGTPGREIDRNPTAHLAGVKGRDMIVRIASCVAAASLVGGALIPTTASAVSLTPTASQSVTNLQAPLKDKKAQKPSGHKEPKESSALVQASTAAATRTAAMSPTAAAKLRPALAVGASSPAVIYVQHKLGVKPESGFYGPLTRAAVKKFQKSAKVRVTGKMNAKTWKAMLKAPAKRKPKAETPAAPAAPTPAEAAAARPLLKFGDGPQDPAVILIQQFFHITPESGYFGVLTRDAVIAYQKGLGISPTGKVGPLTWQAISEGKVVAPAASPAATPAADPEAPQLSADPTPAPAAPQAPSTGAIATPTYTLPENPTAADLALVYALSQVGKPYVMGGNGPDVFDCSGLIQQAYLQTSGIKLPRLASIQRTAGVEVTLEQIVPGDLLYYQDGDSPRRGHISMYAGNGLVVEAANPRRGVRMRTLLEDWYAERFVAAVHIG